MGQIGVWQFVIVAVLVVLLFGRGKISAAMGDLAKGINSFKKGLNDTETDTAQSLDNNAGENVVEATSEKTKTS